MKKSHLMRKEDVFRSRKKCATYKNVIIDLYGVLSAPYSKIKKKVQSDAWASE